MLSAALARYLAARDIHYGWVVAATTFLAMLATAGAMGAPGVMIVPLQQEFGWQTTDISSALAIRLVLFGLMGPFAAAFMNHYGIRQVVTVALLLILAGLLGSLLMTEVWQLVLLWGVIIGIGTGMTALVLGATVATRWFTRRRGLVIGMMTASSATGQLVFLPLLAALTDSVGWRLALCLAVGMIVLAMLLVLLLMRDRPADLGLPAYGELQPAPPPMADHRLRDLLVSPLAALREASQSQTFWVLFGTFFICGFSTNGLIQTHWITLCGDFGVAPVGAAGILAVIGLFDLAGTIASGWLSDRYDNRWLLFWYYGLRGLSLLVLPLTGFSMYGLTLFAVFYGLDWVATVPPTVRLAADRFGKERANLVFGWIFMGHQLGAATAAYGGGAARDGFASYLPALYAAGALCILAALLALTIGRGDRRAAPAGVRPAPS
ncbi:MAG TPA: MFS transporter [Geminicoccus sp.]|uniref:MFS transporter n=1 Tax=Geminicoccus sp. TaxID=2024832 RepID=UPI002C13725F|nr:MFS transporter [Geminicoccus sp.]HWL70998.1 MFS transporter [Geminicoccus sp.]